MTRSSWPSLSAFVPLRNTYLNTYESIRGQGEARKIPLLNASFAGLGFQVHPQQQVVEARVVAEGVPASVRRHQAFEFFKPVEDDVDLACPSFLLYCLDHQKPLAVARDIVECRTHLGDCHANCTEFPSGRLLVLLIQRSGTESQELLENQYSLLSFEQILLDCFYWIYHRCHRLHPYRLGRSVVQKFLRIVRYLLDGGRVWPFFEDQKFCK